MLTNKLNSIRHDRNQEEGFSLIELMIVVVIIGILAAIAIPIFANQQRAAITASVKSDVRNTNTNVVTYLVTNPSATGLENEAYDATTNPDGYKVVATDNNTVTVTGAWNAYTITGSNGSVTGSFVFDSEEGTYEGTGEYGS